ncbi:MAG: S49 family peptidase [Thiomonas sp.]
MNLSYLAARVLGTPLMIHRAKLDVILSVIGPRMNLDVSHLPAPQAAAAQTPAPMQSGRIAVIPIHGSLLKRAMPVQAASGLLAYEDIGAMLDAAIADPGIDAVLLDVDSPGGEVGGCFELAARIRQAAAVKPVWAVANDSAFSAGYALACAASRVLVTQTGGVGSVGVIALHVDQSGADAQDGLRYTPIFAGAHKNDYSPHAPLSDPARAALQAEIDRLYGLFVDHVAAMRGISADAVRSTEAALFFGPHAVETKLADGVADLPQALQQLSEFLSSQGRLRGAAQARALAHRASSHRETPSMQDQTQQDPAPQATVDAMLDAAASERRRAIEIAQLCAIAGQPQLAADCIASGDEVSQVRQMLLARKAAAQSAEIVSTVDPDKTASITPTHNPLMQAVRRIASKE